MTIKWERSENPEVWVRGYLAHELGEGVLQYTDDVDDVVFYAKGSEAENDKAGRETVLRIARRLLRGASQGGTSSDDATRRSTLRDPRLAILLGPEERRRADVIRDAVTANATRRLGGLVLGPRAIENVRAYLEFMRKLPGANRVERVRVAQELEREFGWSRAEAENFAYTGQAPDLMPLRLSYGPRPGTPYGTTVTLEVHTWISAETVKLAYEALQLSVLGHGTRTIGLEALDRFDFAYHKRAKGAEWPALFKQWEKQRPKGIRRAKTWRAFRNGCKRTEEALLHPPLALAMRKRVLGTADHAGSEARRNPMPGVARQTLKPRRRRGPERP